MTNLFDFTTSTDTLAASKMSMAEFGETIKAKYPQYKDMDSIEIGERTLAKYPAYKDKVQLEPIDPTFGERFKSGAEAGLEVGADIEATGRMMQESGETIKGGATRFLGGVAAGTLTPAYAAGEAVLSPLIEGALSIGKQFGEAVMDPVADNLIIPLLKKSGFEERYKAGQIPREQAIADIKKLGDEVSRMKTESPLLYASLRAAEGIAEVTGIGEIAGAGAKIVKKTADQAVTTIKEGADVASQMISKVPVKGAKQVVTRDIPEAVVKRDLGFTPKERSKIEGITGKTEGAYVLEKGLAGKGKSELAEVFAKQANDNYVGIDKKLGALNDTPVASKNTTEALNDILDQLTSTKKFQRAYADDIKAVKDMLSRGKYTLLEQHRVRKSFDKVNTGMYTAQGKARSGLDKDIDIRIRNAISNELQEGALKSGIDVKAMNAELRAGIEMKEALLRRLSQEERNNFLGLQDIGVGAILSGGDPFTGIGLVASKKYLEGVAPAVAQKAYNLNKAKNETSRMRRGNPITGSTKSSKLGLVTKSRTDLASTKVKPKPLLLQSPKKGSKPSAKVVDVKPINLPAKTGTKKKFLRKTDETKAGKKPSTSTEYNLSMKLKDIRDFNNQVDLSKVKEPRRIKEARLSFLKSVDSMTSTQFEKALAKMEKGELQELIETLKVAIPENIGYGNAEKLYRLINSNDKNTWEIQIGKNDTPAVKSLKTSIERSLTDTFTFDDLMNIIERIKEAGEKIKTFSKGFKEGFKEKPKLLRSDITGGLATRVGQGIEGGVKAVKQLELKKSLSNKYKNIDLYLYDNGDEISLDKIIIPKTERNKGLGTKVMEDIISYADNNGKTIKLTPSKDFGGTVSRLKNFYKRFGFVENKGRNKDYSISDTMYRKPVGQGIEKGMDKVKELTDTEKGLIFDYTKSGGGTSKVMPISKQKQVSNALKKLPDNTKEVFSGQKMTTDQLNEIRYAKDDIFTSKRLISSSASKKTAQEFMEFDVKGRNEVMLEFPKGGKDISEYSAFQKQVMFDDENEILFPVGQKFKVEDISTGYDLTFRLTPINGQIYNQAKSKPLKKTK